jgi:hypothetical protein
MFELSRDGGRPRCLNELEHVINRHSPKLDVSGCSCEPAQPCAGVNVGVSVLLLHVDVEFYALSQLHRTPRRLNAAI